MLTNRYTPAHIAANLSRIRSLKSFLVSDIRYELRSVDCRNPRCKRCLPAIDGPRLRSHGPYWYGVAKNPPTGRYITFYIGRSLDTHKFRSPEGNFDYAAYALSTAKRKKDPAAPQEPKPKRKEKTPGDTGEAGNKNPTRKKAATPPPD